MQKHNGFFAWGNQTHEFVENKIFYTDNLFYDVFLYFFCVARPPLMCLSALFSSSISRIFFARYGFIFISLSLMSLCTVVVKMILFVKPYVGQ